MRAGGPQANSSVGGGSYAGGMGGSGADGEMKLNFDLDKTKGKLREILEDSEEEYKVPFCDPQELLDIFSALEEQNLFLIQQGQENEQ